MSWSSWFRINSRMINHLQQRRVFLGGDAAHIHSPAGAQGMNTGIQDMINLCWKLAMVIHGKASPKLLDTYGEDRIPVIRNVLTKTERLTAAIGSENPVFRTIFNHVAPLVVGTEFVQEKSAARMSQVALNYRESSLSETHGYHGSLRAGDRVPDMTLRVMNKAGGAEQAPREVRLFSPVGPPPGSRCFTSTWTIRRHCTPRFKRSWRLGRASSTLIRSRRSKATLSRANTSPAFSAVRRAWF